MGVTTDSDASGTPGANGTPSYYEYLDGSVSYSVTFVNNTAADITGAFADCTFPVNFSLNTDATDAGWQFATVSGVKNIRWPVDIPAGASISRQFRARIISGKPPASITATANLRQGTVAKPLVSAAAPVVKISVPNFTAAPNSPGQPWVFTFKPASIPENSVAAVQTSPDGTNWTVITSNHMTLVPGTVPQFSQSTADIPAGSHYFRALIYSFATGFKYSSVVNNYLPATALTKVTTKSTATVPPKSGQPWTFAASNASTAANVSVRFQSTEFPFQENTWTDLPQYTPTVRAGSIWTSNTFNVPSGTRYFRAKAAAPGWVDSVSSFLGPVTVTPSALILPPFTYFHIDFVDPARNGKPATFYATTASVGGSRVRFQSKLQSQDDSQWADLPDGVAIPTGTKWALKTSYMPVGLRDWRAISSAPGYLSNTTQVYKFEVLPPPLPQISTYFGSFIAPLHGGLVKAGTLPVSLPILDYNGLQSVQLQYATTTVPFKTIAGSNMTQVPNSIIHTASINFTGTGILFGRL